MPGLFYNGLNQNNQWTGDLGFPGERPGSNLKVIQELWTALHLARVSQVEDYVPDAGRRQAAVAAPQRSLKLFKAFYTANGKRNPEYQTFAGADVPNGNTGTSLVRGVENFFGGDALPAGGVNPRCELRGAGRPCGGADHAGGYLRRDNVIVGVFTAARRAIPHRCPPRWRPIRPGSTATATSSRTSWNS